MLTFDTFGKKVGFRSTLTKYQEMRGCLTRLKHCDGSTRIFERSVVIPTKLQLPVF